MIMLKWPIGLLAFLMHDDGVCKQIYGMFSLSARVNFLLTRYGGAI